MIDDVSGKDFDAKTVSLVLCLPLDSNIKR